MNDVACEGEVVWMLEVFRGSGEFLGWEVSLNDASRVYFRRITRDRYVGPGSLPCRLRK